MEKLLWRNISPRNEKIHIATIEVKRSASPPLHCHDFYECFIVLEGRGIHRTAQGDLPLKKAAIYFLRPEQQHSIIGQNDLVFLNLAFEADIFENMSSVPGFPDDCWTPEQNISFKMLSDSQIKDIQSCVAEGALNAGGVNSAWLLISLSRILSRKSAGDEGSPRLPEWLEKGLSQATSSNEILSGDFDIHEVMNRSREHVNRSFRRYLGMTPSEWLNRTRIQRACLLLTTTKLSVLEIAMDCGFSSQSYFHQRFQDYIETTPLQYRKHLARVQIV